MGKDDIKRYDLHVRDMKDWTEDEVWDLEKPAYVNLTFDTGEIVENVNSVDVIISWYYWQVAYYFDYIEGVVIGPKILLNGGPFTDKIHTQLMFKAIEPTIGIVSNKEEAWHVAMRGVYDKLYNALTQRLQGYASTINVPEILDILFDPDIKAINDSVEAGYGTVDQAYAVLDTTLASGRHDDNTIVESLHNSTIPKDQFRHSFGPRGRTTDIDSEIYAVPLPSGFARGFTKINHIAKESRSPAKSILYNKAPVANAEYANRKFQLTVSVIERLVPGDCGTDEYHVWDLPEDDEYGTSRALLKSMEGLTMITDEGRNIPIRAEMVNLLGTRIKFRTTLTCRHLAKQGVCEKCYGAVSYSLSNGSNPGHVSTTSINHVTTQTVISVKHTDFITHTFKTILYDDEEVFFRTDEKHPDDVFLAEEMIGHTIVIEILKTEAKNLIDVNHVSNFNHIEQANLSRVSSVGKVNMHVRDGKGKIVASRYYDLTKHSIKPHLSVAVLKYLKAHGWEVLKQHIVIELKNWKPNSPLFTYPHKHANMPEFGDRVERFLRSTLSLDDEDREGPIVKVLASKQPMLSKYVDVDRALYDTYYLISEKLKGVYLGHIATVLAASRANDPYGGDSFMPKSMKEGKFYGHELLMRSRSLGPAMLYQKQSNRFNELDSYLHKNRPTSILDDFIYIAPGKYVESKVTEDFDVNDVLQEHQKLEG